MATILPFKCIRPEGLAASKIAALPYDVYNREEAKLEVEKEPLSFLSIDRAEVNFDDSISSSDARVYQKAKEILEQRIEEGFLFSDLEEKYYIYELTRGNRIQTGVVACVSVEDYLENRIKKHENTREEKEKDRILHVDTCNAQTGPIFLAYRDNAVIREITDRIKKKTPLYDFVADDGVRHRVFSCAGKQDMESISQSFLSMDGIYIADGHHRAASAVKVALKRRKEQSSIGKAAAFETILSVLFPDTDLCILPYNRFIKDINHHSAAEVLDLLTSHFNIVSYGDTPFQPDTRASFGMYLDHTWYKLTSKLETMQLKDSVSALDVSILQNYILDPILNIKDPRTDSRIGFIGGIRGLSELSEHADAVSDGKIGVAFSMYPTSMQELFSVADQNMLMPPKSTWFEPKLRSGLFIHSIETTVYPNV